MADDSDLIVNVDLLVESESLLKGIQKELKDLNNRKDDMRPYWGSGEIADAMDKFVDNWDDHRGKLLDSVKTVGELVKSTINGFSGADAQLAAELRKARKKQ
ncbi:WXG100 family type VII secretion target [Streptomyces sp. NPDC005931]|uniref:WXG100 family type VII secretion target n=1 Tax=Streptomyces sp. NPDC005931 TaxID=3364737 RepID=UPI0036B23777